MKVPSPSRVLRLLRSRKLAFALFLLVAAWSLVGALGFEGAYSSPVLYALVTLLFSSTVACAWERTQVAVRRAMRKGHISPGMLDRLKERPRIMIEVPSVERSDPGSVMKVIARELQRLRLRPSAGPRLLEASSSRWGLVGSPLFHWSLAALILVIALGQLTRAEGLMGIPVGSSRPDVAESYGVLDEGPFYAGHTGFRIEVTDMVFDYTTDGVNRGAAPVVSLYDGEALVTSQRVYPNSPLRHGPLLIHMDDYGLAPVVVLLGADGLEHARQELIVDFDDSTPEGVAPVELELTGPEEEPVAVTLQLALPPGTADVGRIEVAVTDPDDGSTSTSSVGRGEPVPLPGGEQFMVEDVGYYARISIADDWSVPFIYALFTLSVLSMTVAILVPHRHVLVFLTEESSGAMLYIDVRHSRGAPAFAKTVEGALRSVVDGGKRV